MGGTKAKRILIAGAGRSGTGYTAAVFRASGLIAGHEKVFNPETPRVPVWRNYQTESSWLCLPWLPMLDPHIEVVHLVRDPLHNARSFMGLGMFEDGAAPGYRRYTRPIDRVAPGIMARRRPLERWLGYWIVWNETVERFASRRWNTETIATSSAIPDLCRELGLASPAKVTAALAKVPTTTNSRRRDNTVELDQIWALDPHLVARFSALCRRYGYPERAKPE